MKIMTRRFISLLIVVVFTFSMMFCSTGIVLAADAPIVVSEEHYDYGLQDVGRSSGPYRFAIQNISSRSVKIISIMLSGEHSSDFLKTTDHTSGKVIQPGKSSDVFVSFSPTLEGKKTADLIITYDETDPKTITINLSGTAIPIIPEERGTIKGVIKNQYGEDFDGTLFLYDAETGKSIGISPDPKTAGIRAEGPYTIENILPGRYKIFYAAPDIKYIHMIDIPVFLYKDADSIESATEIEVKAGSITEGIDFYVPIPLLFGPIKDRNFGNVKTGKKTAEIQIIHNNRVEACYIRIGRYRHNP